MTLKAVTHLTTQYDSAAAGRELAKSLLSRLNGSARAIVAYGTMAHDQTILLRSIKEASGGQLPIIGCSTQGVMVNGRVVEAGYAAGAMVLGGDELEVSCARVHHISTDTFEKGRLLASNLHSELGGSPSVIVLHYDPLDGIDVPLLLAGIASVTSAPVIGAAAGAPPGPMVATFQYFHDQLIEKGAVALGLRGPFDIITARSSGVIPTGAEMTITKAEGNRVLELDGRNALDVWSEMVSADAENTDLAAAWSLGLRSEQADDREWTVMAASSVDEQAGAIVLQASVPEGIPVMLHQRSKDAMMGGIVKMADRVIAELAGRKPVAVMGFECGARTAPFLGEEGTQQENSLLRRRLAPDSPWLGMLAWGEITPVGGAAAFCNYTYPVLAFAPKKAA